MELLCGYEVLEEIASREFATLYRVREFDPPYRELTAKRFRHYTDQPAFEREVHALNAISGTRNTQQFVRAAQHQNELVIFTPYIAGESLQTRVEQDGPMAEHEAIRITTAIANTLLELTNKGWHHLAVKPSNILVHDNQVNLTDFSLAERSDRPRSELIRTDFSYTAPEKYFGYHTDRSDLYSLGITLFYLLTGQKPFNLHGTSNAYKLLCHCTVKLTAPEGLSPTVKRLLEWMTHKHSAKRPSLRQLLRALKEAAVASLNPEPLPLQPHIKHDTPHDAECFALAARQGVPYAQYRHARNLERHAPDDAAYWYDLAAKTGYTRAKHSLAKQLSNQQLFIQAVQFYERAANGNHSLAQYHLAKLYTDGAPGITANPELAHHWLTRAADNGHDYAQNLLAISFEDNNDLTQAFTYYRKAAYQGMKAAQHNLARLYENGTGNRLGDGPDLASARFWYNEAARQGHARAALKLAELAE